MTAHASAPPAGLLRRLAACFYDGLLLLALWMVGTALWLPFTGGEAIPEHLHFAHQFYLTVITVAFFVGFWRIAGQTLGMRAWHLRVEQQDGRLITLPQALMRCAVAVLSWAAFGLGYLWILIDRERRSWHDIASGTRVVRRPRR